MVKKIISVFSVLCLCLCLCVPVMAAEQLDEEQIRAAMDKYVLENVFTADAVMASESYGNGNCTGYLFVCDSFYPPSSDDNSCSAYYRLYIYNPDYRWDSSRYHDGLLEFRDDRVNGSSDYSRWAHGGLSCSISFDGLSSYKCLGLSDWNVGSGNKVALSRVIYSSHDLIDVNGTVFFEGTPHPVRVPTPEEVVEGMQTETLPEILIPYLTDLLAFLIPFGVGLTALLVALPVLRRVLAIFLN